MRRRRKPLIKRTISGTLACLLTAVSVLSTSSAVPAMASESTVKMSYKQEKMEKIGIHVEAENESFSAGENVLLNVYIQNNSGEQLTNGTLKWFDKKETLSRGGFVYDSEHDAVNADEATPASADADVVEETAAEETAAVESVPAENAPVETAAPAESVPVETGAAPAESAPAETEEAPAGPSSDVAETTAAAGPAGPSSDVAETTAAAGPASDSGEFGTSWEDEWFEEDEAGETIEGPYLDSEGNLCNIDLAPGEIFEAQFSGIIDDDIYGLKNRDIRFSFGARKENGRRLSNNFKFQFNTGLMTMLPVEFADGNQVEANEEHTMMLHLGLDDIEYMFEEIESSKPTAVAGTPSEAAPATLSEAEKEFTAADVVKPETEAAEATLSEAAEATPSEAEEIEAEIEAALAEEEETADEKATPSEAAENNDEDEDEEGVFHPEDVKYTIETYGVRLKGVKARFDQEASGSAESVTEVSYRVASGTEPGLYFGKVTASVKFNGNTYKTVQGFHINVTGEGQMVLKGMYKDSEIVVSGPAESFPDGEILSLKISEITEEQRVMLEEALKKMAEETGTTVEAMVPMDIKVIADGAEQELNGPVSVAFRNMELESTDNADEEKSLIEKARALLGEEEEKDVDGVIDVWHLDEDAVALDKLDSSVTEDGDVVMTTDHFSVKVLTLSRAAATAAAQAGDKNVVVGDGITFKLFDYSCKINKKSKDSNEWRSISPYFSFRGDEGTASTENSNDGEVRNPSRNDTYDEDGFTKNHATVERVLKYKNDVGYPVLDLSRQADGTKRTTYDNVSEDVRSLGYLFGAEKDHAVTEYTPKNTILQKNGTYYWYESKKNAVDYDIPENLFRVRNYAERNSSTSNSGTYGDFLPFDYTGGTVIGKNANDYHVKSEDTEYWFGMTMDVDFFQTKDGKLGEGADKEDMTFYFSGDDDVWVFVDDVLVLDLGGTHGTVDGSINFATGEILQYLTWGGANSTDAAKKEGSTTSFPTTLRACFDAANKIPNGGWSSDGKTFADYSEHTLKFFYMERGSSVANCKLDFRLPTLPDKSLTVTKELSVNGKQEVLDYLKENMPYKFRVMKADASGNATNALFVQPGTEYDILVNGTKQGTGTVADDGTFTLKAGEAAQFANMLEKGGGAVKYVVQEIMPDTLTGQYSEVKYEVNSAVGSTKTEEYQEKDFTGYATEELRADETQMVIFRNVVNTNNLVKVKVTKEWGDGSNYCSSRPAEVKFQLYADGIAFPGEGGILTLDTSSNKEDTWTDVFENLPQKNASGADIVYTVKELNGTTPVEDKGSLPGKNGKTYSVTYSESAADGYVKHVKIVNKHLHGININKVWSDGNAEHAEDPVLVGLYKDGKPVASESGVQLLDYEESDHTITGSFADLEPASYTVKELVEVSADAPEAEKEFQYDSKYYKGLGDGSRLGEFYKVTYSGSDDSCDANITITNTLSKAIIKIGKWIDNYDSKLAGDQFMIDVNVANGETETGLVLSHEEVSDAIEVYTGDGKVTVTITEIVPKEYKFVEITEGTKEDRGTPLKASNGEAVNISVGTDDEIVLWVHNKFTHKDYFHNSAEKTNDFDPAEKPGTPIIVTAAIVPERKEWERLLSEAENM